MSAAFPVITAEEQYTANISTVKMNVLQCQC